jgi:hypothetical protein
MVEKQVEKQVWLPGFAWDFSFLLSLSVSLLLCLAPLFLSSISLSLPYISPKPKLAYILSVCLPVDLPSFPPPLSLSKFCLLLRLPKHFWTYTFLYIDILHVVIVSKKKCLKIQKLILFTQSSAAFFAVLIDPNKFFFAALNCCTI